MTKRFRPYNHNCNIRISIILNYDREFALLNYLSLNNSLKCISK